MKIRILLLAFACWFSNSHLKAQVYNYLYPFGIGGGGALFSPSISPFDSADIYMSCDMTELFFTWTNGGHWEQYNSLEITAFQNSEVQFTSVENVQYVLNMEFREELTFPVKSTDAGESWTATEDPTNGNAQHLFANPNNTHDLILSSWNQIFISQDEGDSWSLVFTDPNSNLHLAGVFWDGQAIYIGTNYGLIVSLDGGLSFNPDADPGLPANVGFSKFAGARLDDTLTFFGVGLHQADLYTGVQAWEFSGFEGLFRRQMDANAGNWELTGTNIPASVGLYQVDMAMEHPNIAYVAGTNAATSYPVVYKTMDGGDNWESVFLTLNNENITTGWSGYQGDEEWYYGEYALGLDVNRTDPNDVVLTDLGFVHITNDGGQNWNQGYVSPLDENPPNSPTPKHKSYGNNRLQNTSTWWVHRYDDNIGYDWGEHIFVACGDIGGMYSPGNINAWSFDRLDRSLNSSYQFISDPSGNLYAATSSVHDLYQSTYLTDASIDGGTGRILVSADTGQVWEVLHDFDLPVVWMAIDPNDPEVMYASVVNSLDGGIYKTENLSAGSNSQWEKLPNPPRTEGHPLSIHVLEDGSVACSFSGRRTNNFTESSGVFYSTDGGMSWEDRSHPDMYYWTKDLVIDPNDQDVWYACVFSGWGGAANDKGGLFRSYDRGQTWENILDLFRVESIAVSPLYSSIALVTTEDEGLWVSTDIQQAQPTFTRETDYPFLHPLRVFWAEEDYSLPIYITSFGNGLRRAELEVSTDEVLSNTQINIQPNPTNGILEITGEDLADLTEIRIYASDGKRVKTIPLSGQAGTINLNLNGFPNGAYFLHLHSPKGRKIGKVLLQR
ncbi:MAG: T9SS type A sorting domain-containing protein [Bacteroidetes bacterium]|nr:T9SS type A sorting domain-containing protein [Bacteroidota bacterium]